jgi:16S rRNA processing protein RimM|tara:strand:- start:3164 stop:3688 length:525 start_codon:yes stop_codon:yes gene_type:complete
MSKQPQSHNRVVVGIVKGVRGLQGELRIDQMSDVPGRFDGGKAIFLNQKEYIIASSRYDKNKLLIKFHDIDTREKAEALNGLSLYIDNSSEIELPAGSYFHYQLLGLKVFDDKDSYLGVVKEILQTGANDVYIVGEEGSKDLLLPAISSVIKDIDVPSGNMVVHVLKGLLPEIS